MTIREKKRAKGKLTTRRVPLSPRLVEALTGWLAVRPAGQFLFSLPERLGKSHKRHAVGDPMTTNEAHSHFQHAVKKSRWNVLRGWHVFRHSFCSNLAAQGVDQRLIDAWVGHTTEEMRRRYRHLVPSVEQAVMRSIFGGAAGNVASPESGGV